MSHQRQLEPFPDEFSNRPKGAMQLARWYWSRRRLLHYAAGFTLLAFSFVFGEVGHGLIHIPSVAHDLGAMAAISLTVPASRLAYRRAGPLVSGIVLAMAYLLFAAAGLDFLSFLADKLHVTLIADLMFVVVPAVGIVVMVVGWEKAKGILMHCCRWLVTGSGAQRRSHDQRDHFV